MPDEQKCPCCGTPAATGTNVCPSCGQELGESAARRQPSPFPMTTESIWERVRSAKEGDSKALGELCVLYQKAILAYVLRWKIKGRFDRQESEDLAQKFIARILERNPFQGFERRGTKFRSFLLRCLKNFLRDELARGCVDFVDDVEGPDRILDNHPDHSEVDSELDVTIAWEIHERVVAAVGSMYGKSEELKQRFEALKAYILGVDETYADLAGPLRIPPGTLRKAVHDLRDHYYNGYRQEVTNIVAREEVVEEMRYLIGLLAIPRKDAR